MTAESSITNAWGAARATRVSTREVTIHRAVEGAAYNHHPQMTSFGGRLLATWSMGLRDEDQAGQRMVMAASDDGGRSWSGPTVIEAPPGPWPVSLGVVTSEGIHVHGRTLAAYAAWCDLTEHGMLMYYATGGNMGMAETPRPYHTNVHTRVLTSDDGGQTWRRAGDIVGMFPNLGPSATASGRLIMPGALAYPWTDDPRGIDGWTVASLPRLPRDYFDGPQGHLLGRRARQDSTGYCEGSFFQTDDGVIHMMLRTDQERLAVTQSRDDGRTWSEPMMTDYTDCRCRFQFGRLPDGRFFGLSCPKPHSPRTPLVLALSREGVRFDRHYVLGDDPNFLARIPGVHKYGRYGYPSCCVAGNVLHVIYSINKEDIATMAVPLSAFE